MPAANQALTPFPRADNRTLSCRGDTNDLAWQLPCTACHVMGLDDVERVDDLGKRGTIPAISRG